MRELLPSATISSDFISGFCGESEADHEDTLSLLHAWDDEAVQDSSKNLQVLWSRAVLAKNGELADDIALQLLPKSTRGVVTAGLFDGVSNFLEWVSARTVFLNEGCDAFLSSPACAGGKDCQVVIFGAGFDTRSIRYQREGLRFFEVDLPDTIEAKRVVHERYRDEVKPDVRLPTRIGWDLNDCEHSSLLDHLAEQHGFRRDVPTMFISEAVMFYVNPKAIASLYDEIFEFGQSAHRPPPPRPSRAPAAPPPRRRRRRAAPCLTSHLPPSSHAQAPRRCTASPTRCAPSCRVPSPTSRSVSSTSRG